MSNEAEKIKHLESCFDVLVQAVDKNCDALKLITTTLDYHHEKIADLFKICDGLQKENRT